MKPSLKFFFIFSLLCLSLAGEAKELPVFSLSGSVTRGRLASGIEYFLVPEVTNKGYADFALVQLEAPDSAVLRASLRQLPHFRGREPFRFLADAGVGYRRDGYLRRIAGTAVFAFHDVPVYRSEVADSLCLMLMDIATMSDEAQALMICGDIDAAATLRTLSVLSLMTPPALRESKRPALPSYHPLPYECHIDEKDGYTALRWEFRFPRLAAAQMNTPLPFVLRLYASCLSHLLDDRIRDAFTRAGIPFTGLEFRYRDSSDSPLHECYSILLNCFPEDAQRTEVLMTGVLAAICENGAGTPEFLNSLSCTYHAQERYVEKDADLVNARTLHRLVNYYLYGASLASSAEVSRFFSTRPLSPTVATGLFNRFVRELLAPVLDGSEERQVFLYAAPDSSSLGLPLSRVRLISDRAVAGGGRRWTFSNGMKVVFRRQAGGRRFRYAVSMHGGYHNVRKLQMGEGPFIASLWERENIAGLRKGELDELLQGAGVEMEAGVSLGDFRLEGEAPSDKYPLLFKVLYAMGTRLERDSSGFEYFKARQELVTRCSRTVDYLMDSMAVRPYLYGPLRDTSCLTEDLQERAHAYFRSRFSAMNDGLIVLSGDLDEAAVKKFLCRYLGSFKTSFRRDRRVSSTIPVHAGGLSVTVPAERGQCVSVAMYGRLVLTRRNYMAFRLAQEALEKELVRSLADKGLYAEVSAQLSLLPEEWVCLRVRCRPCVPSGLPEGIAPDGAGEAALALRAAVDRLRDGHIAPKDLAAWKAALVQRLGTFSRDPDAFISSVLMRDISGKDFYTDYPSVIKDIRAEDLQAVLTALYDGCRIEYTEL